MGDYAGGLINGFFGIANSLINNDLAGRREGIARGENYMYNEMAAENSDRRTRALYNDLYSPEAQMRYLKAAGLSPSIYSGGGMGISGQSGAMGAGAGGISPNVFGIPPVDFAQAAALMSQAKLNEANAENARQDTDKKFVETEYQNLLNGVMKDQLSIIAAHYNLDGEDMSLYELAEQYFNYQDFENKVEELHGNLNEVQSRTLRQIFQARSQFARDISVLSEETISANFQLSVIRELQKSDFASLNADAACKQLKASVQTSELTEQQKEAWNNLLHSIEKKRGATAKDIVIILSMFINNALAHYNFPSIINKEYQHTTNNNVNTR